MFENWQKLVSSNKIDLVHEKITYYITKTRWEVFTYISSRKISSHSGSSVWTPTRWVSFPFLLHGPCVPFHWWSTGAVDWLFLLELHLACQWPFLEQPLQTDSQAGQLSHPGGWWHVPFGHCEDCFCGGFQRWWDFWTTLMVLPAHIAAAPDSTA